MKVNLLKQIIKEAVREAFKEEIKDSLYELYLLEDKAKNTKKVYRDIPNTNSLTSTISSVNISKEEEFTKDKTINNLLNETKNSLTQEDLRHMFSSYQGQTTFSDIPETDEGLDISNLSFVKTASKIYKASNQSK